MTSPFQRDPTRDPGRRDLGDLLLEERFLTEGVLRAARRLAKRERLPMVVVLLEGGHVSEAQVVSLLSRRTKLPVIDPQHVATDEDIIREMPYDLAEKHRALPLSLERDPLRKSAQARLRVALADPLDREAIDEIEALTGHQVDPVIAPAGAILSAVRFHYRGAVTRGAPSQSSGPTPAGTARRPDPHGDGDVHSTLPTVPRELVAEAIAAAARRNDPTVSWPAPSAEDDPSGKPGTHVTQPLPPEGDGEGAGDAAPLEVRLTALINVLSETGILSQRVYQEAVQRLLRGSG